MLITPTLFYSAKNQILNVHYAESQYMPLDVITLS